MWIEGERACVVSKIMGFAPNFRIPSQGSLRRMSMKKYRLEIGNSILPELFQAHLVPVFFTPTRISCTDSCPSSTKAWDVFTQNGRLGISFALRYVAAKKGRFRKCWRKLIRLSGCHDRVFRRSKALTPAAELTETGGVTKSDLISLHSVII